MYTKLPTSPARELGFKVMTEASWPCSYASPTDQPNQPSPRCRATPPHPELEVPRSLLSSLWIRKDLLVRALNSMCPVSVSRKWPWNLYLPVLHRSWSSYIPDPGGPPCQDPIPFNCFSCHHLISHLHNAVPGYLFPLPLPPSSPLFSRQIL